MMGMDQSRKWVHPLSKEHDCAEASIGAKAASLLQMTKLGLPVPPAFCVTKEAYEVHIAEHLEKTLAHFLKTIDLDGPEEQRSTFLQTLRKAIRGLPLLPPFQEAIAEELSALSSPLVAVRSSSTLEDLPGQSFAGQYESFLNVPADEACFQAVKNCWASLWTDRAVAYRERMGLDHQKASMAVVVQAMVHPQVSGVLFTVDPVGDKEDRLVIEACSGLGEALVQGQVTPDRFLVARRDPTAQEIVLADEKRDKPLLEEEDLKRLVALALRTEEAFETPLDLEWSMADGKLFLLQARPITTISSERSWEERQIWTNANTGEVLPDVVTPLTWCMVDTLCDAIFDSVFGWIGIDFGDHPLVGQIAGRAYFNINTFVGALLHFPGLRRMDITRVLGGASGQMDDLSFLEVPEEDIPDLGFHPLKLLVRLPLFVCRVILHTPKRGSRFVEEMKTRGLALAQRDWANLSDEELVLALQRLPEEIYDNVRGVAFAGMGMLYFTHLDALCRRWLHDEDGTYANRLLASMGKMDSAEAGLALWRLASYGKAHPEVETVLRSEKPWVTVRSDLETTKAGQAFMELWNAFMETHGHHTRGELELSNARWKEEPDYILGTVRAYLASADEIDPLATYERKAQEREALTSDCLKRLRNPIKRVFFKYILFQAQRGSVVRENVKSEAVRILASIRAALVELGKRMAEKGIIEEGGDIFYLRVEELESLGSGASLDARQLVLQRRAEYQANMKLSPPHVVKGVFDPLCYVEETLDTATEILKGIPVSPGVVTGPARVIQRADSQERVLSGEILVAPFTDPGWTPYFVPAAAIVMDQGGLLSHGSIVAREYGIPAVVNVGPATRIIQTGQIIQVDGIKGEVRVRAYVSFQ